MPLLARNQTALVNGNANKLPVPMRPTFPQQRAFTAAALPIHQQNRSEAQRLKRLKQPWQEEAWEYRDAIGELGYATRYLGNSARRMVLVPSAYVPGELNPIPLDEIEECPKNVLDAANDALDRLAVGGPMAVSGMLRDITENFEVAGECYLIGQTVGGQETWQIHSISEVDVDGDGIISLKDDSSLSTENGKLASNAFISRLWWPHPRRKAFADSPFKSILDLCEELLILSRDVRAAGRSRLVNSGILLVPDTLTIVRANTEMDAEEESTGDEFFQELVSTAMAAIQDEGSASAVLPIVVRGPETALDKVKHLVISRPDPGNAAKRQELLVRMATSIDLPAEVLTGKADLNHWTAWQVSDDAFRHHIEPIIQVEVDALTLGYYRPELTARNVDPEWVHRIVLWYDPTNLIKNPDRSKDALDAHDRFVISDESLRDYMGFDSGDAPTPEEILERLARKAQLDPTIAGQIIKKIDDSIDIENVGLRRYGPGPGPGRPKNNPNEEEQQPRPENKEPEVDAPNPNALPASAAEQFLQLIQGGLEVLENQGEFGGKGSGRYPKGSGGKEDSKGREHGVGKREAVSTKIARPEQLNKARGIAQAKYDASPDPTPEDFQIAKERHARNKRQGGDDRPGTPRRRVLRQQLVNEFGDGKECPCVACGRMLDNETVSLDRIIPGSANGRYVLKNLVPMDYQCNQSRGDAAFTDMKWVKKKG